MVKKIICLLLAIVMILSLSACKDSTSNESVHSANKDNSSKKNNAQAYEHLGDPEKMKEELDFGGESITIMREWEPYGNDNNVAHNNFNKWVKKTEKKFNVKIIEKKWKSTLANEMLAGIKPEGNLYLIGYNNGGNIIDLATKGYITPLNNAMEKTGITMNEEIYSDINVQHGNINGKQWSIGVGFARVNATILYNKKLTKAAGYDIEKLIKDKKWTWDKMTEVGQKTTKRNTFGEVTQWGIGMNTVGIKGLILSNGGNIIYPNDNGKFVSKLDSPNTLEALQLAYNWYNVNRIATSFSGGQWTDGNKAFAQNKVALYFAGQEAITAAYQSLSGDDYGVGYIPMGPQKNNYISYMAREQGYVIPTAYKNMATELLLLVDELHQFPVEGHTRDDEFRDEWSGYFHTSNQYKIWRNHHFSNNVERVWEGMDLISLTGKNILPLTDLEGGKKTPTVWANNNHTAYNVLADNTAKNITYTGGLELK